MELMKFLKLSLLSNKERRGLQIDLSEAATVLVAGNGFGKSAILKSLYEAFGAKPHKIDRSWRDASVTTLVEFSISETKYAIIKTGDVFTLLTADKKVLLSTSHVVAELGPYLAQMLSFHLILANKQDQAVTPPPSYMFAPFYVDQDRSWQKPWDSFADLHMFQGVPKALSEYHSGLRANAYYEAKATRDLLKSELQNIDAERKAVDQALQRVIASMQASVLTTNLEEFKAETERLVQQCQQLHDTQIRYRSEMAIINEEHQLWFEHASVVQSALSEIDESFAQAVGEAPEVDCPMCGHHYENRIADQFELVADKDELLHALQVAQQHLKELSERRAQQGKTLDDISRKINEIAGTLSAHRKEITLRDVVTAEGKAEASRVLTAQLAQLDHDAAQKQRLIEDAETRMKESESRIRKQTIKHFFSETLKRFAESLDVKLPEGMVDPIVGLQIGRGSEGPRALAAYYYAFLLTARKFGSATFCPIVIDAPNQQGQDKGHLQELMRFLLEERPLGAQVIIGAEKVDKGCPAQLIDVSNNKHQVLRAEEFESTMEYVRPYLRQSIL